jgi:hypothetical protein
MIEASLLGLGVGLVLGLTGAGGGVLAVPALVLGLGFGMTQAVPVALIAVAAAALLGCLDGLRRGVVRYRAALVMAAFGVLCAPLGSWLAQRLPERWLLLLFCAVMLLAAVRMVRQALAPPAAAPAEADKPCRLDPRTGRFRWNRAVFSTFGLVGGLSGLCTGLLGVGGGFLIVPAVRQVSDLGMHAVVATSLMVIALVSAGTVATTLARGGQVPPLGWLFVAATMAGMLGGRLLAPRVPGRLLQLGFAGVAAAVAAGLALHSFGHPLA